MGKKFGGAAFMGFHLIDLRVIRLINNIYRKSKNHSKLKPPRPIRKPWNVCVAVYECGADIVGVDGAWQIFFLPWRCVRSNL